MKVFRKLILVFLFAEIFSGESASGQTIPVPLIDSVSVMDDNRVCVGWSIPSFPNISRFIIYRKKITDFAFTPVDTVNASLPWVWYDHQVDPQTERWYYAVAALNSGDTLSGLSAQHSYPVLSLDEYNLCEANQNIQWLGYVGAVVQHYELINHVNGLLYYRSITSENSSAVHVVPGSINHIRVRAHFNNSSASSPLIEIIPDTIQINREVSITRIQRYHDFFDIWVKNQVSADRENVLVFYDDGLTTDTFSASSAASEVRFNVPARNHVVTFSCAVTDVCEHQYSNSIPIQSIWLNMTNRPNNILLQWNRPEGFNNFTYSIIYNDGEDRIAAQLIDESYYFFEFTQNFYTVPELCFRIEANNDTLAIISNTQCLNIEEDLLWPNAFIPDGDGFDETFRPVIRRFYPETYNLEIFDKKGQLLFKTGNPDQGWNGYYNGTLVPLGAYIWKAAYTVSGKKYQKDGLVNIIY